MTDAADKSVDLTILETESVLIRHRERVRTLSRCTHCEENPVHVETNGLHWQYCERCAKELRVRK